MSDVWVQEDGFTPAGFESAAGHSTVAYSPHGREGMCAAKNHTCKGRRTKTSIYCAGHERALNAGIERKAAEREAAAQAAALAAAEAKFESGMAAAIGRIWGHA